MQGPKGKLVQGYLFSKKPLKTEAYRTLFKISYTIN